MAMTPKMRAQMRDPDEMRRVMRRRKPGNLMARRGQEAGMASAPPTLARLSRLRDRRKRKMA